MTLDLPQPREEGDAFAPEATAGYVLNQTMLRVRDPEVSIPFYQHVLGMTLVKTLPFADMGFTLYFLGYVAKEIGVPSDGTARVEYAFAQPGMLELTHNHSSENQAGPVYHDGNSEPRGFGHIGVAVPDVMAACARFEELGVEFVKRPGDGTMKGIAFIKDPDGYWIEIFSPRAMPGLVASLS